jgi:putative spermidine/putrescine transport system permease protein
MSGAAPRAASARRASALGARALRRVLSVGLSWLLLGFLFLPVLVLVPVALTDRDYLSLPEHGLSLQHFAALAQWEKGWLPSMLTSLVVASAATAVSVAAAAAYALGAWALSGWWPPLTRVLLLSPLIVPPIVYAVGIFKLWARLGLLDTYPGVILVHVVLSLPFAILAIGASLAQLDPRLIQAARSLGARPPTVFFRVVMPNVLPGVAAGAVFAFVTSWDEITVTLFITSRAVETLPRRIFTGIADSVDPALAAISAVLLAVTVLALVARTILSDTAAPKP